MWQVQFGLNVKAHYQQGRSKIKLRSTIVRLCHWIVLLGAAAMYLTRSPDNSCASAVNEYQDQ
jgi:hypothetical protein